MAKPPFTMSKYATELDLQRDARKYYQERCKELEADANRYQLLRELIKTKDGLVDAQALLWNAAPERKRLDRYIDHRINAD